MTAPESRPLRLLFVCVENANRSQMAEAFARRLGGEAVEAWSAGSRPSASVNPKAVAAMAELGYDLSAHRPTSVQDLPPGEFDVLVTLGCGEACPAVPARRRLDWQIPDPRDLDPEAFRKVRDRVRRQVAALLAEYGCARE